MKLSNPFASVRNFIRTNEPYSDYTTYTNTTVCESPYTSANTNDLYLPMQDKSLLLRPLSDTHLIEVYNEAIAMRLSEEFISLIKQAIDKRGLSTCEHQSSLA